MRYLHGAAGVIAVVMSSVAMAGKQELAKLWFLHKGMEGRALSYKNNDIAILTTVTAEVCKILK